MLLKEKSYRIKNTSLNCCVIDIETLHIYPEKHSKYIDDIILEIYMLMLKFKKFFQE